MPRTASRDRPEPGNVDLGRIDQPRPRAYADRDTAIYLSIRAVQYMQGKRSYKLLIEYARLRKRYWGQHLWARGYWVTTSGNVTDEVWKRYIEEQRLPAPDDDGNVV